MLTSRPDREGGIVADTGDGADLPTSRKRSRLRHAAWIALIVVALYGLLAYIVLPALWTHHEHQKGLTNLPMVTLTGQGIPGDAINVGLIGDQRDVVCAMHAAGWFPADPITLKSSIEIIGSVLLDRQYKDAPVSNLYYLGRREDLAFEKPVGNSADHRNHVRGGDLYYTDGEVWVLRLVEACKKRDGPP
jgi:hypothetical protein